MKTILNITICLPLLLFITAGIISCSGTDSAAGSKGNIPEKVSTAGDQFIISHTGREFFQKYITLDMNDSKSVPEGYFLAYRFYMPERPYIDEKITFGLDSAGAILKSIPVTGMPECASDNGSCSFLVGIDDARKIAEEAGLQKGIKDWGINFTWNDQYKKYVWSIISTTSGSDGPNGFRGSGVEMLIDPNSGEVLTQSEWNVR